MWIYHKRPLMRSYAHVVIIGQNQTFFHVAASEKTLMIRSRARICEGDFRNLRRDDDLCFVVRPITDSGDQIQDTKFRQRAEACLDIRFDYDAENCNCETFANAVHGEWGSGLQVISPIICTDIPFFIWSGTNRCCSTKPQNPDKDSKVDKEA